MESERIHAAGINIHTARIKTVEVVVLAGCNGEFRISQRIEHTRVEDQLRVLERRLRAHREDQRLVEDIKADEGGKLCLLRFILADDRGGQLPDVLGRVGIGLGGVLRFPDLQAHRARRVGVFLTDLEDRDPSPSAVTSTWSFPGR